MAVWKGFQTRGRRFPCGTVFFLPPCFVFSQLEGFFFVNDLVSSPGTINCCYELTQDLYWACTLSV